MNSVPVDMCFKCNVYIGFQKLSKKKECKYVSNVCTDYMLKCEYLIYWVKSNIIKINFIYLIFLFKNATTKNLKIDSAAL